MVGGARLVSLSHSELGQVYIRLGSKQEVEEELGEGGRMMVLVVRLFQR